MLELGNLLPDLDVIARGGVSVVIILIVAVLAYWVGARVIRRTVASRIVSRSPGVGERRAQTAASILDHTWRYMVVIFALLALIATFQGGTVPAVVFTSVAGVAIGFGAQSFLKDLLGGLFMIFEGQFAVGDRVRFMGPDVTGEIIDAGIRVTTLKDDSGHSVHIPNGGITGVVNMGPATDWTGAADGSALDDAEGP